MDKIRIMIVEDESIVAMDIKVSLENMGYEVPAIVDSGKEAVAKAEEISPDLILMDIVLRGRLNGIDAAGKIHSLFNIPVIYLTAYADEKILEQAKMTEPSGYIIKPFHGKELHSTIKMALYKHGMEKKLKESQEWLSTVLNSIGDAVIATDRSGHVIFMNPVVESLLKLTHDEVIGKAFDEILTIVNDVTGEKVENPIERVLKDGTAVNLAGNNMLVTRDGTGIPIDDSGAPIRDAGGNLTGVVLVLHDITARKKAEEELKEHRDHLKELVKAQTSELIKTNKKLEKEIDEHKLAREKKSQLLEELQKVQGRLIQVEKMSALGRMAADVAHEIRNPLTSIGGFARRLEKKISQISNEEECIQLILKGKKHAEIITSEVNRLERVLREVLTFSKEVKINLEYQEINGIIKESLETFVDICKEQSIQIEEKLNASLPEILIDKDQIRQAVNNLISNAVGAMPEGGRMQIKTFMEELYNVNYVVAEVVDTGHGIQEEKITMIFEPFYSSRKIGWGTGLGLSICKKIIDEHNGLIKVKSELGKGTSFKLLFPYQSEEEGSKMKCWEFHKCGMEKTEGAAHFKCPSYPNYGRICWAVAGTFCGGKVCGAIAQKLGYCQKCEFYKRVVVSKDL